MFLQENISSGLVSSIKFNRLLSLIIALNLLAYSKIFGWIILIAYMLVSELFIYISRNRALSSKRVSSLMFDCNVTVTTSFLLVLAFILGNMDYVYLCIIPIFQSIFYNRPFLVFGVLATSAISIYSSSHSFEKLISFITVLGILTFLGFILNRTLSRSYTKADYLHGIATTDALTGLLNRREFDRRIAEEFSRAKRHKAPLSLALFDIDHFKKINDTYGHNTGDTILKEIARIISANTRNCDIFARYGGEEFVLILPETGLNESFDLMDRLRQTVEKEVFNKAIRPIRLTMSIGVAQLDVSDTTPVVFIERTDKALYKAKQAGRNKVERAPFGFHFVSKRKEAV